MRFSLLAWPAACFVCLCLFFVSPVSVSVAADNQKDIADYSFPDLPGKTVKTVRYTDSLGDNVILLTETDIFFSPEDALWNEKNDAIEFHTSSRSKELAVYSFLLKKDGAAQQNWRVYDFVRGCSAVDMNAEFEQNSLQITDLDNNGIAEVWMVYYLTCRSDPSPLDMKIIMYEGQQKYALRGETRIQMTEDAHMGDTYTLDAAFGAGPAEFTTFAKGLWEKYKYKGGLHL